jgi:hypothetical protein
MTSLLQDIVALLAITNPLAAVPVFLAITESPRSTWNLDTCTSGGRRACGSPDGTGNAPRVSDEGSTRSGAAEHARAGAGFSCHDDARQRCYRSPLVWWVPPLSLLWRRLIGLAACSAIVASGFCCGSWD